MTTRTCKKCSGELIINSKLGLMECETGRHVEPINTVRAQWWNQCTKCHQVGLNDIDGEARLMRTQIKIINGKNVKVPVTHRVGDKQFVPVFDVQLASPIKCRACGNVFTKE